MQHKTKTAKLLLTLIALGFLIWFGGSVIRTIIAYDLFEPGTALVLRDYYTEELRINVVRLFAMSAFYTDIAYGIALLSSVLLCIYLKGSYKDRGWLFMAFVLVFISSPVELYMIYLDIKLNLGLYVGEEIINYNNKVIKDYFLFRITKMTIPSTISYLAFLTAIIFIIWRPLDRTVLKDAKAGDENGINKSQEFAKEGKI
jgi:hypothetical protein